MPRRKEQDLDIDTADADGIASANVTVAAAGMVLDGVLTSGGTYTSADGLGHIITITDTGSDDQTLADFTLTGTDANDQVISEKVDGPNSTATVVSTKFYKTLTSIALSATVDDTDAVNIGTRGTTLSARGPAYVLNHYNQIAASVALDITGTCNVDLLETFDNLLTSTTSIEDANWVVNQSGKTADQNSQLSVGATGVMLEVNTYSTGAEIQVMITQPRD